MRIVRYSCSCCFYTIPLIKTQLLFLCSVRPITFPIHNQPYPHWTNQRPCTFYIHPSEPIRDPGPFTSIPLSQSETLYLSHPSPANQSETLYLSHSSPPNQSETLYLSHPSPPNRGGFRISSRGGQRYLQEVAKISQGVAKKI